MNPALQQGSVLFWSGIAALLAIWLWEVVL